MKLNVKKKEQHFDHPMVIVKFRSRSLACVICERVYEILTKELRNIYIEAMQENYSVNDNGTLK